MGVEFAGSCHEASCPVDAASAPCDDVLQAVFLAHGQSLESDEAAFDVEDDGVDVSLWDEASAGAPQASVSFADQCLVEIREVVFLACSPFLEVTEVLLQGKGLVE